MYFLLIRIFTTRTNVMYLYKASAIRKVEKKKKKILFAGNEIILLRKDLRRFRVLISLVICFPRYSHQSLSTTS